MIDGAQQSSCDVLALHRDLVGIPSISHDERAISAFIEAFLRARGAHVERIGDNLVAHGRRTAIT